jgi:hypothetical protein
MSHPNLFQVFHPICGVRASPLSYPKASLESRSSKLRWLAIGLRSFMGKGKEGFKLQNPPRGFYVYVEERHAARATEFQTMNGSM